MFDFPNTPTTGQQVTGPGGQLYQWDGTKWIVVSGPGVYVNKAGDTMTGALTLPGNAASALQAVPLQQLTSTVTPAWNDVGRNTCHNPLFNIWQRGSSVTVTPAGGPIYLADRWFGVAAAAGDTMSMSVVAHTDANRAAIGDESAQWMLSCVFAGGTGASNYCSLNQRIENVRRLANKTVTVSWWANASAALNVGVSIAQNFGTGGSPSASVFTVGPIVAITTTWGTRYSATITLPSVSGKVFGTTGGTDFTQLCLVLSSPSNPSFPAIGAQSGTINFWGMQLEVGSGTAFPTPLERPDPAQDLAKCQRFYFTGQVYAGGYSAAAVGCATSIQPPVTMRASPTITITTNSDTALTSPSQVVLAGNILQFQGTAPASSSGWSLNRVFTASADL